MKRLSPGTILFLAVDIALAVFCCLQIPVLTGRSEPPVVVRGSDHGAYISEILDSSKCINIRSGDNLILWNGVRLTSPDAIEFLDGSSLIGGKVPLTLQRAGSPAQGAVFLVPSYTGSYIAIVFIVALVTWCLGMFVLVARQGNYAAKVLHWGLIMTGVAVALSYEGLTPSNPMPVLTGTLFLVSYVGTAVLFLLFTLVFPRPKPGSLALKTTLVVAPAAAILALMLKHYASAVTTGSLDQYVAYSTWFGYFHILLILYVGGSILSFIHSSVTASTTEERKKLQWALWGLSLGPLPFLMLVILPRQVYLAPLIPEEYALLALLVIPISFVVSFVKHRLMDIELVIKRTTSYAIVISILLATYAAVLTFIARWIGQVTASALAAVLVALFFEPARQKVQVFVDRRFFRVRYDFQRAEQRFVELIKGSLTIPQLAGILVRETQTLIPLERIGFFIIREPGSHLMMVAHEGFDKLTRHAPRFETEHLKTNLRFPVGLSDSLETGIPHELADAEVFKRWGMSLVFPLLSQERTPMGFLVLGRKKSALRFSSEDVGLLANVCTQAGLAMERIILQEKLFAEHQEQEHLRELDRLKSDFVAYVTHELRTPLTSIKMFAELLGERPLGRSPKGKKYVRTITGEADRLDRMVTTILDSARIDAGMKVYECKNIDLVDTAQDALAMMRYQLDSQGFSVEWHPRYRLRNQKTPGLSLPIHADREAVIQAITNLVSNAIRYSGKNKYLKISLNRRNGQALCTLCDHGNGIPAEALPHVFERFYRGPSTFRREPGFGLGLPLVKHIMETHHGSIKVTSKEGRGSTFSLSFPLASFNTSAVVTELKQ